MPKIASKEDRDFVQHLVTHGAAKPLDPKRVMRGKLVCACSDGQARVVEAILANHRKCVVGRRTIHLHATEGGGLIYDLASTIPDSDVLSRIFISRMRLMLEKMPEIEKIVLVLHWPCAMATEAGYNRASALNSVMRARDRVERELDDTGRLRVDVHLKLQIGVKDDEQFELLSVYVDPDMYIEYLREHDPRGAINHQTHQSMLDLRFPRTTLCRVVNL